MTYQDVSSVKQYVWILRLFSITYVVVGALFLFHPHTLIEVLNDGSRMIAAYNPRLGILAGGTAPLPTERFFVVLTTAMMAMLVVTAFLGSLYPQTKGYLLIHLASKLVSVAAFLYFFFRDHQFPYLVGALTDAWVVFVILFFYLRAIKYLASESSSDSNNIRALSASS